MDTKAIQDWLNEHCKDWYRKKQLRVLVCGGRNFANWQKFVWPRVPTQGWDLELYRQKEAEAAFVNRVLDDILDWVGSVFVIDGAAPGADSQGYTWRLYAQQAGQRFPADWDKHGKSAGSIRNQLMLFEGKPDIVVAFPGGVGTADMVRKAKRAGVPVLEVEYK